MRTYNIKRKKAFSLTELLIVIIIIGVLAGIAMLSMSSMDDKLKTNEILENLRMAKEATQNYYTKNGTWPAKDTKLNDTKFADIIDKKLPDEYQIAVNGKSIFVKCSGLDKQRAGVRKKLAEMAKENDLWNSSSYTNENDKYYKDTGKGTDTIHLPVELGS